MASTASEYEIETFSGKFVNTARPDPASIDFNDIAHALSQTCRYGGHCRTFYSVAEHAIFVSRRLERKGYSPVTQLIGLHHDDAEAYLGDIPRPMKPLLGGSYDMLSDQMDEAVVEGLGLPFEAKDFHQDAIKEADNWSLFVEARFLLPSQGKGWGDGKQGAYRWDLDIPGRIVVPDYWLGGISPDGAKVLFQQRHAELIGKIGGL